MRVFVSLFLGVDENSLGPEGSLDPAQSVVVGLVTEDETAHAVLKLVQLLCYENRGRDASITPSKAASSSCGSKRHSL